MKTIFIVILLTALVVGVRAQDWAHVDFTKADSVAEHYAGFPLRNVHMLAMNLTRPLPTDELKFRSLFKWVCDNIQYDYALQQRDRRAKQKFKSQQQRDEWMKSFSICVLKELREHRRTVCTGYAYLLRELAVHAGLDCRIVDGYCKNSNANWSHLTFPNHSWNAVFLHGKWYLCDPTWSSGFIDERYIFVKRYDDAYFLPDPGIFVRNHYPIDTAWTLLDHNQSLLEFVNAPIIYRNAFHCNVKPTAPATFDVNATRGETIYFEFQQTGELNINKTAFTIKSASGSELVNVLPKQLNGGIYSMPYTFLKKGRFTVHVLINDAYAFTYSVKVT